MPPDNYTSQYYDCLDFYCSPGKILIIYGPRQVGKTTLLKHYLARTAYRYKVDSGDNLLLQSTLWNADFKTIQECKAGYDLIAIASAKKNSTYRYMSLDYGGLDP